MSDTSAETSFANQNLFANETPEERQARTERWRAGLRQVIISDISYFHKQRWTRIADEICQRIDNAPNAEARAQAEKEMDTHYKTRFYPETSLEALLAEVDTRELPPPGL